MVSVRVEKHAISKSNPLYNFVDNLCFQSKNVYNAATHLIRQEFIESSKLVEAGELEHANVLKSGELYNMLKDSEARGSLSARSFNIELRAIDAVWKSFFKSVKDYGKHPEKYNGRPKMPGYLDKEKGRYPFVFDSNGNSITIKEGYICTNSSPIRELNGVFKIHFEDYKRITQIRIVPKSGYYDFEVVYEVEVPEIKENYKSKRIAAIDLGVNNLITLVTNCDASPIAINGKPLKSINQYYNKELARMHSELMLRNGMHTSKRIQNFTNKRNRKVDDYIQKATAIVVNYCKENNIDTLVCGYNKGWKQESDIGKQNNQKFVQIPYLSIVSRLSYKCENAGIKFIEREESYTSGTSFLDKEEPVTENYDKSRRKHRGLFVSNKGMEINADVNGAYQILVKEFPKAFKNRKNMFCHPTIVNIPYVKKTA